MGCTNTSGHWGFNIEQCSVLNTFFRRQENMRSPFLESSYEQNSPLYLSVTQPFALPLEISFIFYLPLFKDFYFF